MTSIPYYTCTHVTSKIYPRPRVLTWVQSSTTAQHKSLPQTDWHVVSQLRRAQPSRGGTQRRGGGRERGQHTEEEDREPPQCIQGTNPSAEAASSSLSLPLLRLFQEACCTELPPCGRERKLTTTVGDPKAYAARGTQPITYQKGQTGIKGERRRESERWGRDQRGKREGRHTTDSRKKIER